ncbi:magnesium transporter CorA family protein [Deinococcus lacus]|uniref:Magnesium transporter CorA family protein n=1 Tax=Deinococcus lacus TaxID=392561 RepID=A0ABW1YC89_9DEIO
MIRATTLQGEEVVWPPAGTAAATAQQGLWVHTTQPSTQEIAELETVFAMNEMALEDALEPGHASRYEKYPESDFITFRMLARPEELGEETMRVSVFLYPEAVLSLSRQDLPYLDRVREMVGRETVDTSAEVAFELLDHAADTFAQFATALEARIDEMEQKMFEPRRQNRKSGVVQRVFDLKQTLSHARLLCLEAQDAVTALARHASASEEDLLRFRDVQTTMRRIAGRLDTGRDNLTNLLSIHSSVESQRMNEVMRTLAAVSTIFLPLTFLAGVWGMNFEQMPELREPWGYAMAWGSFVLVAGVLAWIFKRRGWW